MGSAQVAMEAEEATVLKPPMLVLIILVVNTVKEKKLHGEMALVQLDVYSNIIFFNKFYER